MQTVAENFVPSANHRLCVYDRENRLKFLVDTGANISVIPANSKQKSEQCMDYKLFAANNSEIKTYGIKHMTLNLNLRRPYRWTFVIADVNQAILGADFLTHHNLIVDLSAKKLIDGETKLLTLGSIIESNMPSVGTINYDHPFLSLLKDYPEITKPISFNNLENTCVNNDTLHYIETSGKPVHARARPLPPDRYHKVKEEFRSMQEMGICRPSKSEWASPLHIVAKKNGDIRPVGDYRRLNAITKPDRYPVPRLHDFTYILSGKKVFSKIDINKAYFFIKVAPQDIEKTAIITPIGLFEFLRLPFGLRNGSQTFQRFMSNNVLKDMDFLFSFIDDVIVASDTMEEHENHLRQLFQRFTEFGITINIDKCEFGKQVIEFLGYEVSTNGIKPLEHKVKAIVEFPRPETVEQLRRFLGMVNFYRASIPNATKYQSVLNEYLKNSKKKDKRKIDWTDKAIEAFDQCKLSLKDAVMLSHPVPNVPLSLMSDASDKFAGAVLQQWVNDKWLPLGYFSKKFTIAQQKYSTYDRELTAIFMAIKHFRHQFEGRELRIFTDHKPLTFAFNKVETKCETPRRTRQLLFVSEFTTDIRYVKGSKNNIADALSRVETIHSPTCIDYAELASAQEGDLELNNLLNGKNNNISLKKIIMPDCNKLIYCEVSTSNCRPYIPSKFRRLVFDIVHNVSHPGIRSTRKLVSQRYFWPGLNKDTNNWAKTCISCQKSKISRHTKSEFQQFPSVERLSHVHIDIVGSLTPCEHGHRYLITMIDRFTKWPEAVPVTEITAEVVAKVFYETWICRFGTFDKLTTDQGRQFESKLFSELLKLMGIKKSRSSPYHPQSNGMIERWHRSMKQSLRARLNDNKSWCSELPTVLLGLRSVSRSDNGVSPAEYVYGQAIRLPGDFYDISDNRICDDNVFLQTLRDNIRNLKPVSKQIRNSRTLFIHSELNTCDYVFIRNDAVRKPLVQPYDGPYRVMSRNGKVFNVQLPNRTINISVDRLKPAFVLNNQSNDVIKDCVTSGSNESVNKSKKDGTVSNKIVDNSSSVDHRIKVTSRGRTVKLPVRFDC